MAVGIKAKKVPGPLNPHMQCNPKTRAAANTPDTSQAVIHLEQKWINNASTNINANNVNPGLIHPRLVIWGVYHFGSQLLLFGGTTMMNQTGFFFSCLLIRG